MFLATPDVTGVFSPFNHHACSCNERIAISNRVCGVVPHPTEQGLAELRAASKRISACLPQTVPDDYGVLPMMYSGAKRRRYEEATRKVLELGMTARDASITMFIKDERLSPAKINPDPRAIQFRDSRYCVEIARFLKPIEHHLYELTGSDASGLPTTRMVGKGLNQVERAKLLRKKLSNFKRPVVASLDMSRFDQHCHRSVLVIEHSVYLRCCRDPYFAWLLDLQLVNRCFTKNGFVYVTVGKRMSGDMNTALGNCIIMLIMVIALMDHFPGVHWDCMDDGDDCLLILEADDVDAVLAAAPSIFLTYGHEVKIEKVAYSLSSVSWCQSSPIEFTRGRWKFVRDPIKTMSCDLVGSKWKCTLESRRRLLSSLGLCELILNLGVPVLQSYALALIRSAEGAKPFATGDFLNSSLAIRAIRESKHVCPSVFDRSMHQFHVKHLLKLEPKPIEDLARRSFEEAFGLSIAEQLQMEQQLSKWTVVLTGDAYLPISWSVDPWVDCRAFYPERYL